MTTQEKRQVSVMAMSEGDCSNWSQFRRHRPDGRRESVDDLLERCRQYLLLIASQRLGDDLKAKASVSDLVQETLYEAHKDLNRFSGTTDQLMLWLRQILLHRIANLRRRYRLTAKRDIQREELISRRQGTGLDGLYDSDATTPSQHAIRQEQQRILEMALARLTTSHQTVLKLRHREQLTFEQIGRQMRRSADAARMLWWRAFEQLATELESLDEQL